MNSPIAAPVGLFRWAVVASTLAVAVAVPAIAQDTKPLEIRLATTAPQKSVWGMQIERATGAVAEESKGSLRYLPYYGGQLGTEAEMVQQVARGRLDVVATPLGFFSALVPELQVLGLPMYFTSQSELDCILDGPLRRVIADKFARRDLELIHWSETGTLHLVGKRAFTSPADLRGVKAGAWGTRVATVMWQGLGANSATVSGPELASGFQTGLIDVAILAPVFYVAAGVNKPAPVATRGAIVLSPAAVVMHRPLWSRLSAEQRAAVNRVTERIPPAQLRAEVRTLEAQMFAAHEKAGGTTAEMTPAQLEAYRAAIAPLWPKMIAEAGPDAPAFFEQVEAARKTCGGRS